MNEPFVPKDFRGEPKRMYGIDRTRRNRHFCHQSDLRRHTSDVRGRRKHFVIILMIQKS